MASKNIWSHFEKLGYLTGYKQKCARHDKKRNRPTSGMVFKLVFIYFNYKLQNPKKQNKLKGNVSGNTNDTGNDNEEQEDDENEDDVSEESENDDSDVYTSESETNISD